MLNIIFELDYTLAEKLDKDDSKIKKLTVAEYAELSKSLIAQQK